MHPNLISLMLFCFVTSCTPGPNNILASYSSFNFGIKKTFPHMMGVALGYTSMITILDIGLILPFKKYPIIQEVLKVFGIDDNGISRHVRIAPETCRASNFAFDVTPSHLISGLITERGLCDASKRGLLGLYPERS